MGKNASVGIVGCGVNFFIISVHICGQKLKNKRIFIW